MISWNARVTIVTLLLAGTALFLQARARNEFVLPRTALASFPVELQNWVGTDVFLDDESLKTLRPGDFLQRTYRDETGGTGYVDLYVAYLPESARAVPSPAAGLSGRLRLVAGGVRNNHARVSRGGRLSRPIAT